MKEYISKLGKSLSGRGDSIFSKRAAYDISTVLLGGGVTAPALASWSGILGYETAGKIILPAATIWCVYEVAKGIYNQDMNL